MVKTDFSDGGKSNRQNIEVEFAIGCKKAAINKPKLCQIIQSTCRRFGITAALVSVAVMDDTQISRINERFLNRKGITDVISFDLSGENEDRKVYAIAVNAEMALRQSKARPHSDEAELALYILHGLLHNLGFDDSTPAQANQMHAVEDEILQNFDYGIVYNNNE